MNLYFPIETIHVDPIPILLLLIPLNNCTYVMSDQKFPTVKSYLF
jgi:hypothetical protein